MKLLSIGRTGQVATALQEQSKLFSVDCTCVGRPKADLTNPASVQGTLDAVDPSLVINAAAYTAVDAAEQAEAAAFAANAEGADTLARACADRRIPLIHISTDYVFDGSLNRAYLETDPVSPLGIYGASKQSGEVAVREAGPQHVILRTSWVYSPFGKNFVKTMLRLAEQNRSASVVDDQIGCPTSALDIANCILRIAPVIANTRNPNHFGTFHYAGQGACTWADMAELIFDIYTQKTGHKIELNRISTSEFATPAQRPKNSRLDTHKIEQVFGVVPPDWRLSLKLVLDRLID